ncbi:uncharacterized protein EKO05_0010223 [Ascochyta rabiei]|uniref:Uncharacterized protein n=1 Tax=Didymella rabiei TaxID=5454 RepID=A0A162WP62_DIDRA|nr:uncharacterized protein EKO05_0010223 [Ascochyta rabiei]KZM19137.1 hypothetical protein ST47_g9761 [Ascochyta rabiei]UPX19975.1 hypothetical protein EKO05_0010223 [Ascochyta rabiei]
MASMASQQSYHPYLSQGRASTITSWTLSIQRSPQQPFTSDADTMSCEAAIEAYRQLKVALFSKAAASLSYPQTG